MVARHIQRNFVYKTEFSNFLPAQRFQLWSMFKIGNRGEDLAWEDSLGGRYGKALCGMMKEEISTKVARKKKNDWNQRKAKHARISKNQRRRDKKQKSDTITWRNRPRVAATTGKFSERALGIKVLNARLLSIWILCTGSRQRRNFKIKD